MRKNMAPKKNQKKNKKVIKKKVSLNKKSANIKQKKSNDFFLIFKKVVSNILTKPFFVINLVINRALVIARNIFLQLFNLIKQTFKLFLVVKEAFFSILF